MALTISDYYDRFADNPPVTTNKWESVMTMPGRIIQSAEINEVQSILRYYQKKLGYSLFKDGYISKGCQVVTLYNSENQLTKEVVVTDGEIFIDGRMREVKGTYAPLIMFAEGEEYVGLLEVDNYITEDDDALLRDPAGGYPNYNAPGAWRRVKEFVWKIRAKHKVKAENRGPFNIVLNSNNRLAVTVDDGGTQVIQLTTGVERTVDEIIYDINNSSTSITASKDAEGYLIIASNSGKKGKISFEPGSYSALDTLGLTYATKMVTIHTLDDGVLRHASQPSQYAEIYKAIARDRFLTHGNYGVDNCPIFIEEHPYDPNKVLVKSGPYKAFVEGWFVDINAVQSLEMRKGRDYRSVTEEHRGVGRDVALLATGNNQYPRQVTRVTGPVIKTVSLNYSSGPVQVGDNLYESGIIQVCAGGTWSEAEKIYINTTAEYNQGAPGWQQTDATGTFNGSGNFIKWNTMVPEAMYHVVYIESYQFTQGKRTKRSVTNLTINRNPVALTTPTGLTVRRGSYTAAGSTTYSYRVSAVKANGETLACPAVQITDGPANLNESSYIVLEWNKVSGATGYFVYGREAGNEQFLQEVPANQTQGSIVWWVDFGTIVASGALPTVNNTDLFDILPHKYIIDGTITMTASGGPFVENTHWSLFNGQTDFMITNGYIRWASTVTPPSSYTLSYSYWESSSSASLISSYSETDDIDGDGVAGFTFIADPYVSSNNNMGIIIDNATTPTYITFVEQKGSTAWEIANQINAQLKAQNPAWANVASATDEGKLKLTSPTTGAASKIQIVPVGHSAYGVLGFSSTAVATGLDDSEGEWLSVDSYSDYGAVKPYNGIELRDALDFRTIPTSGLKPVVGPDIPTATVYVDYEYYIGRVALLYLNSDGIFWIKDGAPGIIKNPPDVASKYLRVAVLYIPPFTYDVAKVRIVSIENKTFTNADLWSLEHRLDTLEYYMLRDNLDRELATITTGATDTSVGGFTDTGIGVGRADIEYKKLGHIITAPPGETIPIQYKAAYDPDSAQLCFMLPFEFDQVGPTIDLANTSLRTSDSRLNGESTSALMLPFQEEEYIVQPTATTTLNVNPYDVFSYIGSMELSPSSNVFIDTTKAPDLRVSFEGERDAFGVAELAWSTEFGVWETVSIGRSITNDTFNWTETDRTRDHDTEGQVRQGTTSVTTLTTVENQQRTNIRRSLVPSALTKSIGDRVVDVSVAPFIPESTILVKARNLYPNAVALKVTIDDMETGFEILPHTDPDGPAYVADRNGNPTVIDANTAIKTDNNGFTKFMIHIQPGVFHTGRRKIRIFGGY